MSRQLTAPQRDTPTIAERVTGYLWANLRPTRAYPVVERTVVDDAAQVFDLCRRNPDVHRHTAPVQLADGRWRVTVLITDRTRPLPGRIARAWVAVRPAVKVVGIVAVVLAALFGTGLLVWNLWGHEIAAGLRLLFGGVLTAAVLIAVLSWWTTHGRNGCPGLHCTGCKGGH